MVLESSVIIMQISTVKPLAILAVHFVSSVVAYLDIWRST